MLPHTLPTGRQVPLMGLIELVRGMATSDETFEASQRLASHLGKTTCVSQVGSSCAANPCWQAMLLHRGSACHPLAQRLLGVPTCCAAADPCSHLCAI